MNNMTTTYHKDDMYYEINKNLAQDLNSISNEAKKLIYQYFNAGEDSQLNLLNILIKRRIQEKQTLTLLDGLIFDYLVNSPIQKIKDQLCHSFPNGIVPLKSSLKINYSQLQQLLIEKKFKEADQLTQNYLCNLAGLNKQNSRQWLYFTDISFIPSEDLFIIDLLWKIYSQGKFGFSIQRKIWILNNYNWEKLWIQIGWLNKGIMRRYPQEFIWNTNAPAGHLPLFNQLRGNQVLASLFKHIVWKKQIHIQ